VDPPDTGGKVGVMPSRFELIVVVP
jgi:hypothetical protein